jgi:SAM-dependent methyltransferase
VNKKEITTKTYNLGAEKLSKKFNEIGPRTKDIKRAFSFFNIKNPNTLEIGCGNGRDAKYILKYTNKYLGIDISKEMIKLSKKFLPKVKFLVADIENITLPNKLDIVFAFASLLHLNITSIKKLLNKLHEKINNNGIIYISVKYSDEYIEKIKIDEFGKRFFYYYGEEDFQKLAGKTKYKIIYTNRQNIKNVDWLTLILQKTI